MFKYLLYCRRMTRRSPNKRKSVATDSPGSATPKKVKTEPQSTTTPKQKSIKLKHGDTTPAMGKMADSTEILNKPSVDKTPKSAKKRNKHKKPKPPVPDSQESHKSCLIIIIVTKTSAQRR